MLPPASYYVSSIFFFKLTDLTYSLGVIDELFKQIHIFQIDGSHD